MRDQANILISVHGRFVDCMLRGTKRVELRRRTPRIDADTRVWIYSKAPVAAVVAVATLEAVETLHPDELWRRYQSVLEIGRSDFEDYVSGRNEVAALRIRTVRAIRPVNLARMRQLDKTFHPPQFYLKLDKTSPLLSAFKRNMISGTFGQ